MISHGRMPHNRSPHIACATLVGESLTLLTVHHGQPTHHLKAMSAWVRITPLISGLEEASANLGNAAKLDSRSR
jgi:hypothetical protein